jgi:tetratricopeptide (TPR) repeat protein
VTPRPWESLIDSGDLPGALIELREAASDEPGDEWIQYRLAWVCNRLELHEEALEPARLAWESRPWDSWYLGEYMKTLRELGMTVELMALEPYIRGGGTCRYYLASVELGSGSGASPSTDFLRGMLSSPDDSAAADAAVWLSLLLSDSLSSDSLLSLLRGAVARVPDSGFYRSLLAERLSDAGLTGEAGEQVAAMRLSGYFGSSYWDACASLAEAQGDAGRRLWALRRAVESMRCPGTEGNLGWCLYRTGRDRMREGDLEGALELLLETAAIGDGTEDWRHRADSLTGLIHEFQAGAGPDR